MGSIRKYLEVPVNEQDKDADSGFPIALSGSFPDPQIQFMFKNKEGQTVTACFPLWTVELIIKKIEKVAVKSTTKTSKGKQK